MRQSTRNNRLHSTPSTFQNTNPFQYCLFPLAKIAEISLLLTKKKTQLRSIDVKYEI